MIKTKYKQKAVFFLIFKSHLAFIIGLSLLSSELCRGFQSFHKTYKLEAAGIYKLDPSLDMEKHLVTANLGGWDLSPNKAWIIIQNRGNFLSKFSFKNFARIWSTPLSSPLSADPKYSQNSDFIYLGTRDGSIKKISAVSGQISWQQKLDSPLYQAPQIVGDSLLTITMSQKIYCLDLEKGTPKWVFNAGSKGLVIRSRQSIAIYSDMVLVNLSNGEILSLNLKNGTLIWRYQIHGLKSQAESIHSSAIMTQPIVLKNKLYFSTRSGLLASLNLQDKKRPQEQPKTLIKNNSEAVTAVKFQSPLLYIGRANGSVSIVNLRSEDKPIQELKNLAPFPVKYIKALQTKLILLVSANGLLQLISLEEKKEKITWWKDLAANIIGEPIYYQNHLYFLTESKTIYKYKVNQNIQEIH